MLNINKTIHTWPAVVQCGAVIVGLCNKIIQHQVDEYAPKSHFPVHLIGATASGVLYLDYDVHVFKCVNDW